MRIARAATSSALATPPAGSAEQWVHLMPAGKFEPRDGRGPWIVDDAGAVIMASERHARGAPLLVDYEHQAEAAAASKGPVPAAGWINRLEARPDGIWGLIEWTAAAAELIGRREYRFISPVFTFDQATGQVQAILRAGLTNTPALTLTALAKESDPMDDMEMLLAELRDALGLDSSADKSAVISAIGQLKNGTASPAPDKYVPIEALKAVTSELKRVQKGVLVEQATAMVAQAVATGKLPPALKEWGIELCQVNVPAFESFIGETGTAFASLYKPLIPAAPNGRADGGLTPVEQEIANQLGLRADAYARNLRTVQ